MKYLRESVKSLWASFLGLAVVFVLSIAVYNLIPPIFSGLRGFFLNLAAGVIAIFLTVLLIDGVIRRREARQLNRYRSIALQQLFAPLQNHLHLLFNIYKASVDRKPDREISSASDLLGEDFFKQIVYFDLSEPGPAVAAFGQERLKWYVYLNSEWQNFKSQMGGLVDRYAMYLDPDTLGLMEQLMNSWLFSYLNGLPISINWSESMGLKTRHNELLPPMHEEIRLHTDTFVALVDIYNSAAPEDRKVHVNGTWSDNTHPLIGSARVPEPPYQLVNGLYNLPPIQEQ